MVQAIRNYCQNIFKSKTLVHTKTILITGSNGLLGQKLVKALSINERFKCIATAKGINRLQKQEGYQFESLDITDASAIKRIFTKYMPDVVIHTAAMTNVDACETEREQATLLNTHAVGFLIDALKELKAGNTSYNPHLIHLSTDFIFDGTHGPLDENATPNPLSHYARTKLEAENLVMQSDIQWSIARTVLVYGVVDQMSRSNIVLWVKQSLEQGKTIKVVDDQYRTPTLAEDLADGCIRIAERRALGIYNISGDAFLNIYELACKIARYYKLNSQLIERTNSTSLNQPAKRPPITGFIIDKARNDLDYKPHSLEAGIALMDQQMDDMLNSN